MIIELKKIYRMCRKEYHGIKAELQYRLANEVCDMDPEEAEKILNAFAPRLDSSAITHNEIHEKRYDLTIIVPAYNAEKWIRECVESILKQETSYSYKAVIINDGSIDSTGMILDSFVSNKHIEVIHQENKGYSGARNIALKHLYSKYVMFVDSDDYLLPGAIQVLMETAEQNHADIVEGDGVQFDETGKIGAIKQKYTDYWGGPCLKIIRSELFRQVHFPEGYLYEDTIIGTLIFPRANKVIMIPNEVYAYRIHEGSITRKHDTNPRRVDSFWIMQLVFENQKELGIPVDYENYQKVMRHITFTYRRIVFLPEEVKKSVFVLTAEFLEKYYLEFMSTHGEYYKMAYAFQTKNYEKYDCFCRNKGIIG